MWIKALWDGEGGPAKGWMDWERGLRIERQEDSVRISSRSGMCITLTGADARQFVSRIEAIAGGQWRAGVKPEEPAVLRLFEAVAQDRAA